jgi:predicted extracellular nuclease
MANPTWAPLKEKKIKIPVSHTMNISVSLPVLAVFMTAFLTCMSPQTDHAIHADTTSGTYRIMFYNTENLFDTFDDTLTADDDFTPSGKMHWTYKRYSAKLKNTYKVIVAAGTWQPPDIIGLCEVENRRTLEDITGNTPLAKYSYRIIHKNSADRRGIDVALLYNPQTVHYLSSKTFRIKKQGLLTRDILYFKALLDRDTCHFLINHWPSRSEGQLETEPDRFEAAKLLKHLTDSLFTAHRKAKIVIMGDFNDEPSDESLAGQLQAETDLLRPQHDRLYNLTAAPTSGAARGTLKYQGQWNIFDQIIVSGNLLLAKNGLTLGKEGFKIFREPFLLIEDKRYDGFKPKRTYTGYTYQGGFSDHLPVYLDLILK